MNKQNDFFLTIPNVNYRSEPVTPHDTIHDTIYDTIHDKIALLLSFCRTPRSREEMMEFVGLRNRDHFHKKYLRPLLEQEKIEMTIPEKPQSKNQKYRTKET
ncbi:Fic family protein, partial [Tannerella forsythia]|uniref:Fic family protein n=1 Tax=Tannerella forsythia TaxID=28112 RepID=UPI0034DABF3A